MSILDNNNPPQPMPVARLAADRLVNQTRMTYQQMVQAFNQGAKIFWNNPMGASPQDISLELGTKAKEIFELHYKLGQLIGSVKPEAIAEGVGIVGNFTMNEDGTVTIIPPQDPVSE